MEQIAVWLERIGLGKYAEVFSENDVGLDVVVRLSDEDLKELGVSLGDRRRLQAAIEALPADGSEVTAGSPAERTSHPARAAPASEPERRHLTVMFADLVGSTALSQRLDPEDLREVNRAYQEAAKAAIESYDGYVARYMGDGVLAYFGYPQAHEDDAERAVRAGLKLVASVRGIDVAGLVGSGSELSARVGIATGSVVVGDLIGEGGSLERAAVGETPNLAARVEAEAPPGSVVVAPSTFRLTESLFDFEVLGARSLKGIAGSIDIRRVVDERLIRSRFRATQGRHLTALVGRDDELRMLSRRWEAAATEGHAILIGGEPGIGKSRLAEALRARVEGDPHVWLHYQCSPHHTSTPFYPLGVAPKLMSHAAHFRGRAITFSGTVTS